MKEIKLDLNKHELVLIHKQNRNQEIDFYSPKNTEIKKSFPNFIHVDYLDAYFGWVLKQLFYDEKVDLKLSNDYSQG